MKRTTLKSRLAVAAFVFLLSGMTAFAADTNLKVGGFVDGQYYGTNNSLSTEGFVVNDGALYMQKDMDNGGFHLDLPFSSNLINGVLGGNNFNFATNKAQAYVDYKYGMGVKWRLGQFDKLYGAESNDTVDLHFTRQGLLYNQENLRTHTGLSIGYEMDKFSIMALAADTNGSNTNLGGGKMDWGVVLAFAPEQFHVSAGWLMRQSAAGDKTHLYDIIAGTTMGGLEANLEFAMSKPPVGDSGIGIMAEGIYGVTDMISGGVRFDYTSKLDQTGIATGTQFNDIGVTVGPQFAMTKDLRVKADYTFTSMSVTPTVAGVDATKKHEYALAAVYKF